MGVLFAALILQSQIFNIAALDCNRWKLLNLYWWLECDLGRDQLALQENE